MAHRGTHDEKKDACDGERRPKAVVDRECDDAVKAFVGDGSGVTDNHLRIMSALYRMTAEEGLKSRCEVCSKVGLLGRKCCGFYAHTSCE